MWRVAFAFAKWRGDGQWLMGSSGDEMTEPIRRRRREEREMETGQGQGQRRGAKNGSTSNDEDDSVPRIDKW